MSDFDISMIDGSRLKDGGDISPCGIACMHVSLLVEGDTSEQTHCCGLGRTSICFRNGSTNGVWDGRVKETSLIGFKVCIHVVYLVTMGRSILMEFLWFEVAHFCLILKWLKSWFVSVSGD